MAAVVGLVGRAGMGGVRSVLAAMDSDFRAGLLPHLRHGVLLGCLWRVAQRGGSVVVLPMLLVLFMLRHSSFLSQPLWEGVIQRV